VCEDVCTDAAMRLQEEENIGLGVPVRQHVLIPSFLLFSSSIPYPFRIPLFFFLSVMSVYLFMFAQYIKVL
jgi:hypothetical protein